MNWLDKFQQNKYWKDYRFKKLKLGYPKFDFPVELIDTVGTKEFLKVEIERIPLFIGTQFGIYPNPKETYKNIQQPILVAKLDKSLISGCVSGLSICSYKDDKFQEIEYFKN